MEKGHCPALEEKLLLRDLRRPHVAGLIADFQGAGRGAVTIKRIHATLSSALADAIQDGLLSENPASSARLPAWRNPGLPVKAL